MCEQAIDLANHVILEEKLGVPRDSGEGFGLLVASGRLDPELAGRLRKMVGLRNTVVRQYQDVDVEIVVAVIDHGLDDLLAFTEKVLEWSGERSAGGFVHSGWLVSIVSALLELWIPTWVIRSLAASDLLAEITRCAPDRICSPGGRCSARSIRSPRRSSVIGSISSALLRDGTIPLVWSATDLHDVLGSYAALYVREEVQQESLDRNVGSFNRFLEAASFSHASLLNVSAVARE